MAQERSGAVGQRARAAGRVWKGARQAGKLLGLELRGREKPDHVLSRQVPSPSTDLHAACRNLIVAPMSPKIRYLHEGTLI